MEKIDFSVLNVWSNDTCPIIREKREMSKMPLTHEQNHVIRRPAAHSGLRSYVEGYEKYSGQQRK